MKVMLLVISFFLTSLGVSLAAADLKVTLNFDKRPTPSAMVYMLNDASSADAGGVAVEVTHKGKTFIPRLIAAPKGTKILIKNEDSIQHNVYASDRAHDFHVDLGMSDPNKDVTQEVTWEEGHVMKFGCRIHPNMQLWIANIPSKHHVCFDMEKTEKQKVVHIKNVPTDEHTYRLWLPRYDEMTVEIKGGENKTIDIMRKGKKRGTAEFNLSE